MRQTAVCLLVVAVSFVITVAAQSESQPSGPPALVYEGTPIRVPVACGEEEMQSLGMTCSAESPCPVYLELSALEALPGRLIAAGNLHTRDVTLVSVVLASEDNGKTWTESHARIKQGALDQMQFADLANGWIAGQVIAALPRDPFFLVTTDGGKSWRQRPVFAEGGPGAIEKFHFTSSTQGRALVDRQGSGEGGRYALLESLTGGDSWSIRQLTVKAPNVSFDRAPSAAWRIQTNAATKSYSIEKREGQTWSPVAAFLVEAGQCAPKELELQPPPDPSKEEAKQPESDAVEVFQIGGGKSKQPAKKVEPPKKKKM